MGVSVRMIANVEMIVWAFMAVTTVFVLVICLLYAQLFQLYLQAHMAGATVPFFLLVGMKLQRINVRQIVMARIVAMQAGVDISLEALRSHYLAGGHVSETVRAIVAAKRAGVALDWEMAAAIDLSGRDLVAAVQEIVKEKTRTIR